MRVLPVTKLFGALEDRVQGLRQRVINVTGFVSLIQPANDRGVVSSRVGEGGTCQPAPREIAHDAIGTELVQDEPVLGGMNYHSDVRAVLRRGPDHRRPSDVHRLDGGLRFEGVKVADDKVDRRDVLSGEVVEMRLGRPVGKDAGMDGRVQGLHAPPQHLGHARDLGDFGVIDPGCLECLGGTPAGDELDAEGGEAARELLESRLVMDREQRTHPEGRYQGGGEHG